MKKESKLTGLMALMVLLVFALCIVMVLITGTRVYQRLLDSGEAGFAGRTGMQYIATRIRQAQAATVRDFDGINALALPEEIDGKRYHTLVYWHDGYIRELYCAEDAPLHPQDGERVLACEPVYFSLKGNLLAVQLGSQRMHLRLPAEKEIGP